MFDTNFFVHLKQYRYVYERAQIGFGDRQLGSTGAGLEFEDYRGYIPGDDLRFLDWNIYGRLQQLYLKRFRASGILTITIIFDRSASMILDLEKFEKAKKISAALGYVGLNSGETVRLLPIPCENEKELKIFQGEKSVLNFIEAIDRIRPVKASRHKLSLKFAFRKKKGNTLSLVVSDMQEEQSWFRFFEFLKQNKEGSFLLHMISLKDLELPDTNEEIMLSDIEFGSKLNVNMTKSLYRKFKEKFEIHLKRILAFTNTRKIGYMKIPVSNKIDGTLWLRLKKLGLWQ